MDQRLERACEAMWLAWDRMTEEMKDERRKRMWAALIAYDGGKKLDAKYIDLLHSEAKREAYEDFLERTKALIDRVFEDAMRDN